MSVPVTQSAISQGLTSWMATAVVAGWSSGVRVRTMGSEEELDSSSAMFHEVEESKGSRGEEELRLPLLPLLMAAAAARERIIAGGEKKRNMKEENKGEAGEREGVLKRSKTIRVEKGERRRNRCVDTKFGMEGQKK